eukprot:11173599-Lingulodinium_polyedra.AAC.1
MSTPPVESHVLQDLPRPGLARGGDCAVTGGPLAGGLCFRGLSTQCPRFVLKRWFSWPTAVVWHAVSGIQDAMSS